MNSIIKETIQNLEKNRMNAYFAENKKKALKKSIELIPKNSSIGFGGSMSVVEIGLRQKVIKQGKKGIYKVYNPCENNISRKKSLEMRHKGMHADLYITGTNAITRKGELVNVDGYGNRVAAQICGPKKVIIIAGKNKIVNNYKQAIQRIKNKAAPLNAKRLNKKTPCVKTGYCIDCDSEERICNYTTIIHNSREKKRIHVVIVNDNLGL